MYDFAKEMCFDEITLGNRSTRDKSLVILRQSPDIMVHAISKIFLPKNTYEACDRIKLLIQEKQAGKNF